MQPHEPIEGVLIPDSEVDRACKLQIEILEGSQDLIGKALLINAQGLINSYRNRKDGCTIIGCQEQHPVTGEHFNDFVIKNEPVTDSLI